MKLMPPSSASFSTAAACRGSTGRPRGTPRSSIAPKPSIVTSRPVRPSVRFSRSVIVVVLLLLISPRRHGGHGGSTEILEYASHSSFYYLPSVSPPCPLCLRGAKPLAD